MKKKTLISLLFVLTTVLSSFGQKQANVWALGDSSGINFHGSGPSAITTSLPFQTAWCYIDTGSLYYLNGFNTGAGSICDSMGNLLFYTNGEKIWNHSGRIIQNGDSLFGFYSSTQSALILPLPGSNSIFYVFTMDGFMNNFQHGLNYSVVDACLDSGRGGVIVGQKNIQLVDSTGEKLTAVKHSNGTDYWIISHKFWTDRFYAIRLSASGMSDTVITAIGRIHVDSTWISYGGSAIGAMESSPDGRHLIVVGGGMHRYITELFDFDPATGIISNHIDLKTRETVFGSMRGGFGCSFSPNNTKVYIAGMYADTALSTLGTTITLLAQYDISMSTAYPDSIRNSLQWLRALNEDSVIIHLGYQLSPISLQIGPDGKIYGSGGKKNLWVIEYPDLLGPACQTRVNPTLTLGQTYYMPNILPSYAYGNTVPDCIDETLKATPIESANNVTVSLFPNPTKDNCTVCCRGSWRASILDLNGKIMKDFSGKETTVFSTANIPPGIYVLVIQTQNAVFKKKLIVM